MTRVVEIAREHACCGQAFERNMVVELSCRLTEVAGTDRYLQVLHGVEDRDLVCVRGCVVAVSVVHPDGSSEEIERIPSGAALTGFDENDDGHLEKSWTGELVQANSVRYLVEIAS